MTEKIEMPLNDVLLVGYNFTGGEDTGILLVGRREGASTTVVNCFQGADARALYELLTEKKGE